MIISKKININDVDYDITTYPSDVFRKLTIESFGDTLEEVKQNALKMIGESNGN